MSQREEAFVLLPAAVGAVCVELVFSGAEL